MPERTFASGITRLTSAGSTPAIAVAAARSEAKVKERKWFIGILINILRDRRSRVPIITTVSGEESTAPLTTDH